LIHIGREDPDESFYSRVLHLVNDPHQHRIKRPATKETVRAES
jgi:hypothetical protein